MPGGRCRGSCGLRLFLCLAHTFAGWFVGTSSPSILQTGRAWLQPPGLFLRVAQSGLIPSHCPAGLGFDLPTPLPHHGAFTSGLGLPPCSWFLKIHCRVPHMRTVRHADKHWETFAFLKQNSNANALLLFFKSQIVVYRISISSEFSSRLAAGEHG